MLAPELQELERRYSDLLARVDAGTLDFDAALETLGHLTCSDADGFQWGISPEGEPPDTVFLRSSLGGAPVPADPVVFAAAPSATPAWAATPPTVDGPSSSDHPYSFGPNPAQPQQPYTQQPHAGPHPSETDWTTYSGHETPKRETKLSNLTGAFSKLTATVNQVIHPGAAGESDSTRTGPNRRTVFVVIAALVVLLVTVVFLRDDNSSGKPPAGGEPASIECPELTAPVTGISPEEAKLLGCLDGVADPASPQYGPQIARLAVTVNEDNSITYDPALAMTQGDVLSTAVALYFFAGGRPPAESVAVDLAAVPEALQADVQNAVDLGFVKPDAVAVDQPATKADLTVVLATILAGAANADPTTPSQAADAASASEQASAAQAYLVSRGVVPGGTGAFGFAEPLTATTWIDMTAPAVFELQKPGQLAASAASGTPAEFTKEAANEKVSALTSGRVELAAAVISGADPTSSAVKLEVARMAGIPATGLAVVVGKPSLNGKEAATEVTVVDSEEAEIAKATLDWTLTEEGWQLGDWPQFTPTG